MNSVYSFNLTVFVLLTLSWLLTNFVFKTGAGVDMTFFSFLLILSFYRTKNNTGISGTLAHLGLRTPGWGAAVTALALAAAIMALTHLLAVALKVDLADLMSRQKSVGQMGYQIARTYSPLVASVALATQSIWATFFEELFFRGILLRIINPYHHLTAQLLQAFLFGFMHVAGSMGLGLPGNALWFLFLYPALSALALGHFYLRKGNHLTLVWLAHYLVNTATWLIYVYTGIMI